MKKLFCLLLVLLFVPIVAFSDDQDPIVGTWYVYTGILEDPDVYFELHTFHFSPDGNIFSSKYDVSKNGIKSPTDFNIIGLWTKENGKYYINIGLQGAQELKIENGTLFFPVTDEYMIRVIKMDQVNYAKDVIML